MCGRYASFREAQDLADSFSVDLVTPVAAGLAPSWNVAPTQAARIVTESVVDGRRVRVLDAARWGLVPGWAKDPGIGARLINARLETADTKPSFRGPLTYARCVVPAEGYYEWQGAPGAKRPFYIARPDGKPLALAGLYSLWHDELLTFTILTHEARGSLREIHDREPVTLRTFDAWLDPTIRDRAQARALAANNAVELTARPVSSAVNAVRNNGPQLIAD